MKQQLITAVWSHMGPNQTKEISGSEAHMKINCASLAVYVREVIWLSECSCACALAADLA